MKHLLVKADSNDGDYLYELSVISEEELIEFKNLFSKLQKNIYGRINWGRYDLLEPSNDPRIIYKDILTEDDIEFIEDYIPSGEYGIHTIESVKVIEIIEEL